MSVGLSPQASNYISRGRSRARRRDARASLSPRGGGHADQAVEASSRELAQMMRESRLGENRDGRRKVVVVAS